MQSKATTVAQYLAELPPDRRAAIETVRDVVLRNLDKDYKESMQYGMIGYCVPHSVYPAGYHCDPRQGLPFAGLASQKNYMSLYLMGLYCGCGEGGAAELTPAAAWFHDAWARTGKRLDMGKACIRFRKVEDLALDVIGEAIRRVPAAKYITVYEAARESAGKSATTRKAPKKAAPRSAGAPKSARAASPLKKSRPSRRP